MTRYPEMKFQSLAFLLFSGFILFAAFIVWTTIAAYGVLRITFPTKGQKVPVGKIVVSGTSSANATNHCTVSLNINGIKPYQNVTPTGHNGPRDYSKWTFTVTPRYAVVKEGFNKITAKYSCPNMNLTRFYSVNVTGVRGTAAAASEGQHQTVANTSITGNRFPPLLPGH